MVIGVIVSIVMSETKANGYLRQTQGAALLLKEST